MAKRKAHRVAVLAFHGVVPFDLTMPCEVFGRVRLAPERQPYEVLVCGHARRVRTDAFDMLVKGDLKHLAKADTVIVPGMSDITAPVPQPIIVALRAAAANGARIASICSGAFVLAASGLLDGLNATTHWLAAPLLAERYPGISVNPNVLFVDNGKILTSAGAAAGLDLCLHMIRSDHGAAVAADAARLSVMPLERSGGQAQFIVHRPPQSSGGLQPLLEWIEKRLDRALTLDALAEQGRVSIRTLTRRFQEQLGVSPLQWMLQAKVRRAQQALETTDLSIERVAASAGFTSSTSLREHFAKVVGTSPRAYRNTFRRRPH
ncbi:GlxA family transcriptional regulator [Steroidobacter sp.]|uniref:GlxA family transcriptional regulator n=1 Tax=Steroidobacter sp. TaxID=1978227 RepID=UPI0025DC37E4|nr:helix-turn-helix domain-containing protein [Steroidobacter sp.]